jgi:hypothetical protein
MYVMEYRNLLALFAFFVVFLASNTVFARRGVASTGNLDNGSGYSDDEFGSGGENDIDDEFSGSTDDDNNRPVYPPIHGLATDTPNRGVGREHTFRLRSTTSADNADVDIDAADESESSGEVKVAPLPFNIRHPFVLAAIIVGGVLIILCIVLFIMFLVYRMRKKDEGSYILDETKTMIVSNDHHQQQQTSSVVYMKASTNDREFYA